MPSFGIDVGLITLAVDNIGGKLLAESEGFRARACHIEIKHHFVRQVVAEGKMMLVHVPSAENLADCLTKSASWKVVQDPRNKVQ